MVEAHEFIGESLALDFVNTVGGTRLGVHDDKLESYADFIHWARLGGAVDKSQAETLIKTGETRSEAAARLLRRAKTFREALHSVFGAIVAGRPAPKQDFALVNDEIGQALAHARLLKTAHNYQWTWDDAGNALDAPLWPVARSAAELLTSSDLASLHECDSDTCGWLFLDLSKNHSRRWCDMRGCGNREKLRRYRRGARR